MNEKNNLDQKNVNFFLDEIEEKVSINQLLTIDELLEFSRIHLIDIFSNETMFQYSFLTICLYEDFFHGKYDEIVFNNYSVNIEKIKLLLTRLDRNVNDFYRHEQWMIEKMFDDLEEKKERYERTKSSLILLLNVINIYCQDYKFDNQLTQEELKSLKEESEINIIDKRFSEKAPTNAAKIKALMDFCPELWSKLSKSQSKEVQQNVIHAITGVNKEDSYKLSFGHRQSELAKVTVNDFENVFSKLNPSN